MIMTVELQGSFIDGCIFATGRMTDESVCYQVYSIMVKFDKKVDPSFFTIRLLK